MLRLGLLWAGCCCLVLGNPSTSPNSAVMPSVSYLDLPFGWNRSSLEKDIAAVFNKVAYGNTTPSTPLNVTQLEPVTTTVTLRSTVVTSSTTSTTSPAPLHLETPEYTSRTRFKPPLPPEYVNPFADKPILRGSQSESSAGGNPRRRPVPPRPPPEQERIPFRPPDLLVPHDRSKKPLNTPARGTARPQQSVSQEMPRVEPRNDTEFDFVPILQNPIVTRILSGSSGRKVEDDGSRGVLHLDMLSREVTQPTVVTSTLPPVAVEPVEEVVEKTIEDSLQVIEQEEEHEFPRETDRSEFQDPITEAPKQEIEWDSRVWGVAWDIHVYLMGCLFALLVAISILNFIRTYTRLLTSWYFITVNGILLVIGIIRSVFLFFDAYNLNHSYPTLLSSLMLNLVFPCLTSSFSILFLFLLQTTKVTILNPCLQTPMVVSAVTVGHLLLCISLDVVAAYVPHSKFLLSHMCEAVFLIWGLTLAVIYLCVFTTLSRAALRHQCDFLRAPFTKITDPQNASLGLAVRALLATAMLMLLLAAVQLYGLFGVYGLNGDGSSRPWPWWGFQFSVRVIEVSMCFLMVFVATLRNSDDSLSVLTIFSCTYCAPKPEENNKPSEDSTYPAICNTDQAIHNYSLQAGKKVYNDSLPLGNLPIADAIIPVPFRMERSGTVRSTHSDSPSNVRPSSMLFAEDGFVRFRTSADPEQPMEEVLHQSMTYNTPKMRTGEHFYIEQGYRAAERRQQGECAGGRPIELWHAPLQGPLSPAHYTRPSTESTDSDLASEEDSTTHPSSSQDITPDSAVGSDIYSKNGDGPVENNRYWCEDGLDLLSRSLINRLRGSNFSLNHFQGYTPLDSDSNMEVARVLLDNNVGDYLSACKLQAFYHMHCEDESTV